MCIESLQSQTIKSWFEWEKKESLAGPTRINFDNTHMNWLSFWSGAACASLFLIGCYLGVASLNDEVFEQTEAEIRERYVRERLKRMQQRRKKK